MCNANSIKPKKLEISNFFFAYNLDVAANYESHFAQNRFSLRGYIVYHTDHDEFGDGVMFQFRTLYDMTSSYCLIMSIENLSLFAYA
jgi:hypothetical protein